MGEYVPFQICFRFLLVFDYGLVYKTLPGIVKEMIFSNFYICLVTKYLMNNVYVFSNIKQTKNENRTPMTVTCPYCKNQVRTRIEEKNGTCTIVAVIVLVLVCWPLFWIPLCCDCGCKNKDHICTSCHRRIGFFAPCGCQN